MTHVVAAARRLSSVLLLLLAAACHPPVTPVPAMPGTASSLYAAGTVQFALPAGWEVAPLEADVEGYRVSPAGAAGAAMTVAYLPVTAADLGEVERLGVAAVERDPAVTRHFVRISPRTRVAGYMAAQLHFTKDLASGERIDGVWVAALLPDGQVLTVTLTVPQADFYRSVYPRYRQFLQSVVWAGEGTSA